MRRHARAHRLRGWRAQGSGSDPVHEARAPRARERAAHRRALEPRDDRDGAPARGSRGRSVVTACGCLRTEGCSRRRSPSGSSRRCSFTDPAAEASGYAPAAAETDEVRPLTDGPYIVGDDDRPPLARPARDRRRRSDDRGQPRHSARGAGGRHRAHRCDAARASRLADDPRADGASSSREVQEAARAERHRRRGTAGRRARPRVRRLARRRRPAPLRARRQPEPVAARVSVRRLAGGPARSRLSSSRSRLFDRARASRAKHRRCRTARSACASSSTPASGCS